MRGPMVRHRGVPAAYQPPVTEIAPSVCGGRGRLGLGGGGRAAFLRCNRLCTAVSWAWYHPAPLLFPIPGRGTVMNKNLVIGGFGLLGVAWFVLLGLVMPLMAKVREMDKRLH